VFEAPSVASMATFLGKMGTRGDEEVPAEFDSAVEFVEGTLW